MTHLCLFSAPFDFMPDVQQNYQAVMTTVFREIWDRDQLGDCSQVNVWVVNPGQRFVIDDSIFPLFPKLNILITPSTGRNHIDLDTCQKREIAVYSLLDDRVGMETIAASPEFTFLLILNTLRRIDIGMQEVTKRSWRQREDKLRGFELRDKKVGLVGLGRIGRRLKQYCQAFGAGVIYHDPYVQDPSLVHYELKDLFRECDVVCICCILNHETKDMINKVLLKQLRKNACLINTSRGEVLNESDLLEVLREREDLRVGLDVITGEVTNEHLKSPLMKLHDQGQIVITPHIAGATVESQTKAAKIALSLLKRYLQDTERVS